MVSSEEILNEKSEKNSVFSYNLSVIDQRVNELRLMNENSDISIFDILEMFEMLQRVKNISPTLEEKEICKNFSSVIGKYLKTFSTDKIIDSFQLIFEQVNDVNTFKYKETFLSFFESYKLEKKLSESDFEKLLRNIYIPLHCLLEKKDLVDNYPNALRKLFLSNDENIEFLLQMFSKRSTKYWFPKNISKEEYYDLATRYVTKIKKVDNLTRYPNFNYLQLMQNGLKGIQKYFDIDSKLKHKIKKELKRQSVEIFSEKNSHGESIVVYSNIDEYRKSKVRLKGLVDVQFIKQTDDFPSLLNYIKYLDYFFTDNGLINFLSFPFAESHTFERVLGTKSKCDYEETFHFGAKQHLLLLELHAFERSLKIEKKIDFEELINFFFTNYSNEVLKVKWLPLEFSKDSNLKNRAKINFTIEESLRKQWKLLLEEDEIPIDLYNLESTPDFSDLKSYLPNKYVYAKEEMKKILFSLFSDQSDITYINQSLNGDTFFHLISENTIKYRDFHDFQKPKIDYLIDKDIVTRNESDVIVLSLAQMVKSTIYKLLWNFETVNFYNLTYVLQKESSKLSHYFGSDLLKELSEEPIKVLQKFVLEMIEEGKLETESTLFSRQEIDFLNFLLNNKYFDNSLGLRNKYEHDFIAESDNEYRRDYLYSLAVLVFYVMKINEEFHFKFLSDGEEGLWVDFWEENYD